MVPTIRVAAVVAILMAVAVAAVLFTPDPTDDIRGVLHLHKAVKAPAPSASFAKSPDALVADESGAASSSSKTPLHIFLLICIYRC